MRGESYRAGAAGGAGAEWDCAAGGEESEAVNALSGERACRYTSMMSTSDSRARRANMSWGVYRLGEEPTVPAVDTSTLDERIALSMRLTLEQWTLSRLPMPTYSRAEMPGRVRRGFDRE